MDRAKAMMFSKSPATPVEKAPQDPFSPRVEFVGVVNKSKVFEMHLETERRDLGDSYYLNQAKKLDRLEKGNFTLFQGENDMWYCYERDGDDILFMVVVSETFSKFIAVECLHDLVILYQKYANGKSDERLLKHNLQKDVVIQKDLLYLMLSYDEANEEHCSNQVPDETLEKMEDNVRVLLGNVAREQEIVDRTMIELEEQSKIFKDKAKRLKQRYEKKRLMTVGVIGGGFVGAAAGAMAGWLVGGPIGAAALSSQAAEIGVGLAVGGMGGVATGKAAGYTVAKWRNFVRIF